jgi:hypothetical protein
MTARRTDLVALLVMALCAAGIALLQPRLVGAVRHVRLTDEAVALPPPRQLRVMALGYRSAIADLLWAKLVVEQGVRREEKRTFDGITQYIDGIIELEPDHQTLYQFVDTLLIYPTSRIGTEGDARKARAYLERGTRERPYDADVWLRYGQFIAFLAPSFLKDEAEIEQWRKDGAFAILRAVDLGSDVDRSLSAASILAKAGETESLILQLENKYALTDNEDTREQLRLRLQQLHATAARERIDADYEVAVKRVEQEWHERYPFLSRGETLLVGPRRDPARCAGVEASSRPDCASDWSDAIRHAKQSP